MISPLRKALLTATAAFFVAAFGAEMAQAADASCEKPRVTRHYAKKKVHRSSAARKASQGSESIRTIQRHLSNLGYYSGSIDGVMGPGTRAAIKKFQRDHGLKADGVAGSRTLRALQEADVPSLRGGKLSARGVGSAGIMEDNTVHPDYATNLNGTKTVSSRFARLDVNEIGQGYSKSYTVNLNGQSILTADGQATVIGISPTYDMGNQDAVILTTYSPSATGCMYRNHVLVMNNGGSKLLDIENCTREFTAQVSNGVLFVRFPERDAGREIEATWRVYGTSLERM